MSTSFTVIDGEWCALCFSLSDSLQSGSFSSNITLLHTQSHGDPAQFPSSYSGVRHKLRQPRALDTRSPVKSLCASVNHCFPTERVISLSGDGHLMLNTAQMLHLLCAGIWIPMSTMLEHAWCVSRNISDVILMEMSRLFSLSLQIWSHWKSLSSFVKQLNGRLIELFNITFGHLGNNVFDLCVLILAT